MKKLLRFLMLAVMFLPFALQAQLSAIYQFSTGVDNTHWYTLTSDSTVLKVGTGNDSYATPVTDIGFTFTFAGVDYTQFSANSDGTVRLGSVVVGTGSYSTPFSSTAANNNAPKICGLGCDGYMVAATADSPADYIAYQLFGSESDHVLVIEISTGTYTSATRNNHYTFQIQLAEADNSVTLMYSPVAPAAGPAVTYQLGACTGASDIVLFNVASSTMSVYTAGTSDNNASGTWPEPNRYYTIAPNPNACYPVNALAASDITTNSFTLTWTDANNTGATYTVYNGETVLASGISENSYTVSGLNPNTSYSMSVVSNCSSENASNPVTLSVHTACAAMSLPWECGFESDEIQGTTNALGIPWCTERYNSAATTSTPYPYSSTSYPHSGSRSLYFYGTTGTSYPDTMALILPQVDVTAYPMNGNRLTFWAKSSSTSYDKMVYVYSLDNPSDITTATPLDSVLVTGTTHVKYSVPLNAATPTNAYLAIMVKRGSGSLYMDDFTIEEMPSCLEVTNLAVSATTVNSISLSWSDAVNAGATYTIYNMADTSVVGTATETTYTVGNLAPNTTYTFGVQANCTAGDAPITTISALTDCANVTLPWSENFDNWTAKSPCWMFMSGLLSAGAPTVNSSAWALSTSYGSYITLSGKALTMNLYSTNRYWALTPPIEITNDNVMFSFDVAVSAWSAAAPNYDDNDTLAVLVTADNGATFTLLQAFDYNQLNALGNTYTTLYIPATGYNGQTVRFAIYGGSVSGTSPYDNRIAIDNVSVSASSSCMPVANLTTSDVTSYGATLTWSSQATSYTIYNMADTTVVLTTTDTSVVISTLNPNTQYTLGVQANCGNEQSVFVNTTFTTLVTCPTPTNVAVTLTPGNGTVASMSWTEIGTAQAWQICLNGDTNNLIDVTTNPYNFTGLTPEQAYTAQVRAYCDVNDQSEWSDLVNFTPTDAYLVTVNDGTTTNSYVPIYGLWVDDITKSQFIIPATDLAAMQYGNINKLTFYSSNANVSWGVAEFSVYLTETTETTVSALADYTSMTQVYAGTLSISNNIMEVTFNTPYLYMGGNLMVGFLETVTGTYSSCNWYGVSATGASMGGYGSSISQRNFLPKTTIAYTPGTLPTCLPVTGLTASNVTENSAILTWQGTADSYSIIDLADTTVVATVTDTAYTFTNLTPNTQYTIGVVANCGADQSNMVTVSFTTACSAVAIPFTEGFELDSPTLGCWSVANTAASTGLTTTNPYNGNIAFVFAYNTNPPQYLISPELSGTENGLAVSFMYRIQSTSYPESFQLGYSTTTDDLTAFTWGVEQTNLMNLTYEEYSEILPAGVKYVSIKYTANDMYYLFIDDVTFMTPPSCMPASALTVDTATGNSVTISWTGTAASYDVYNGDNFVANVTTNTYTFTGLAPATNYTFGVQAICSATDSANMVTVAAATECGTINTYPYVQDFATAPACWVAIDADGDGNSWILYNGTIQSASYSGGALTPDNWLVTPQFAIPATGNYEVTWTATAQDQSWPAEHYGVFVSTTGTDTANFTMLQEWTLGTGLFNPVIDLTAYAGQNIYIALRHFNCTDQFRLSIDDFIVREQAGANQVTINVGQNNPAYGTVTGGGIYNIGDNVTVSATPASGYTFSKWVDENNVLVSVNNPYTFVAATDLSLTAIFLDDAGTTYTITVQVNDSTMGTATGGGTYTAGEQVTLVATPNAGYNFVNWTQISSFGENVVGSDLTLIITVTGDKTFVANFEVGSGPVITDPTVATDAATAVEQTTATLNATITNPDDVTITAKGFEWKTTTGGTYTQIAGTGTGNTFSANLTGLTENTSYTYKAFITFDGQTVYGNEMTFTTTVGIENHLASSVKLYPNPASEYVDIRIDGDVTVTMMEVYDVYGKLINTVDVVENPTRLNVNGLANGMYFVRVTTEEGVVTKSFLKK